MPRVVCRRGVWLAGVAVVAVVAVSGGVAVFAGGVVPVLRGFAVARLVHAAIAIVRRHDRKAKR